MIKSTFTSAADASPLPLKLLKGLVLLILIALRDSWLLLSRKLGRAPANCVPPATTPKAGNFKPPTGRPANNIAPKPARLIQEAQAIHEKAYDVAKIRERYPRAHEKWTEEEDNQLRRLANSGLTTYEMAVILQRKRGAIRSRMVKLSLI